MDGFYGGMPLKVGGEERMKQMSVGKMMTGGPKGKVVFSSSFELQNV